MNKKIILGITFSILFIAFSNYTGLHTVFRGLPVYHYETENNEFNSIEMLSKGISFNSIQENFDNFKNSHPNTKDIILYRTFKVNILEFWNWHDYITHERYKLPYKPVIKKS